MAKRPSGDKLMSDNIGDFHQAEPEIDDRASRLVVGMFLIVLAFVTNSLAGDGDDTPTLSRPTELPPIVSTPAQPPATATARPTTPASGNRAVLALPGINAPAGAKPATNLSPLPQPPEETASDDGMKLDAPVEMKPNPSSVTPSPRARTSTSASRPTSSRPLTLESPDEAPLPIDSPGNRSNPMVRKPSTTPKPDSESSQAPQRRGRLFGLLPGPLVNPAPAPASSRSPMNGVSAGPSTASAAPGRSVVEGPLPDFAADAALKKRIEKQARELVGDRARSIEVRVVGKTAVVQARGVKLFQKKNVRKSLESIPALTGLKAAVEVVD